MKVGSSATLTNTTVKFGKAGAGGAPGSGGSATAKPSQAGIAQAVYPVSLTLRLRGVVLSSSG